MPGAVPEPGREHPRFDAGVLGELRRSLHVRRRVRRHPDRPARRRRSRHHHGGGPVRRPHRRRGGRSGLAGTRGFRAAHGLRVRGSTRDAGGRARAAHGSRADHAPDRSCRAHDHAGVRVGGAGGGRSRRCGARVGTCPRAGVADPRAWRLGLDRPGRPGGRGAAARRRRRARALLPVRRGRPRRRRGLGRMRVPRTLERDGGRPRRATDPGADRPRHPARPRGRRRTDGAGRRVRPDAGHDLGAARDGVRSQAHRQGLAPAAHDHPRRDPLRHLGRRARGRRRRRDGFAGAGQAGRRRGAPHRPAEHLPDQRPDRRGRLGHGHLERRPRDRGRTDPDGAAASSPGTWSAPDSLAGAARERVAAAAGLTVGAAPGAAG